MAINNNNLIAMNNLAILYFENKTKKDNALKLAAQAIQKDKSSDKFFILALVLLWNNEIEEAINTSKEFLNNLLILDEYKDNILEFILLLIAKKQYNYAFKIFSENEFNFKDRFKPVYYALMYFMQDKYPDEYKKMGSELKQTVDEIIEKINQLAIDYE